MGKAKRATRKELEDIVGEMIQELRSLHAGLTALDRYIGLYIEWKGDRIEFPEHLKKILSKAKEKATVSSVEGNTKSEKKDRYKKISQPL
tara:strand:- start:219 stop:488 length:270 start_codon:yes stop_codon:yes gene_type:complete